MSDVKLINVLNIEILKGDQKFIFSMPIGSQLGDGYTAAHECLTKIVELMQESAKARTAQTKDDTVDAQIM